MLDQILLDELNRVISTLEIQGWESSESEESNHYLLWEFNDILIILPKPEEPLPQDTAHRISEAKGKLLAGAGVRLDTRLNVAFDYFFFGEVQDKWMLQ